MMVNKFLGKISVVTITTEFSIKLGAHYFKVVLEGYCRCPDSHDLSECHYLYGLGGHI